MLHLYVDLLLNYILFIFQVHLKEQLSLDPGKWPTYITNDIREILVIQGPEQVINMKFPVNKDGYV